MRVAILGIAIGLSLLIASRIGWLLQIIGVVTCLLSVCVAVFAGVMDVMPVITRAIKEWIIRNGLDQPPHP